MTRDIQLQGHRGARGLFPENTLDGFAGTLAIGVDVLEMDVGLTADGQVVVTHDPSLNPDITRTLRGEWLAASGPMIGAVTREALLAYDVGRIRPGSAYAGSFPDQAPRDGARIPGLAEVIGLDPEVRFDIELKTFPLHPEWTVSPGEMADAVLAVLDATGTVARATVQSFDWRGLRHLRARRPDVTLSWLTRRSTGADTRRWWDGPDPSDYAGSVPRAVAAEGGPIWAPEHGDLTAELVAEAHDLGLQVVPWTVNLPDDMRRVIGFGVDGLISDRPDLARRVLQAEGLAVPPTRSPAAIIRAG
jgi:glycerophosphoryl diester phosphodiesterase